MHKLGDSPANLQINQEFEIRNQRCMLDEMQPMDGEENLLDEKNEKYLGAFPTQSEFRMI